MKLNSKTKPATEPAPPPDGPEKISLLLTQLRAIQAKVAPFNEQANLIKEELSTLTLKFGDGRGDTKSVDVDGFTIKVSPKTTYTITQEEFEQMVAEFPDDRQDVPFAVVQWKPALDKRKYNALANADRGIVDKYVTSKPGKPALTIVKDGEEESDEE